MSEKTVNYIVDASVVIQRLICDIHTTAGTHQMSIEVKTLAGKSYQYSWDFRVQS